jgi:tRNA uridine 5-carbamoylmethylation protein Kti12
LARVARRSFTTTSLLVWHHIITMTTPKNNDDDTNAARSNEAPTIPPELSRRLLQEYDAPDGSKRIPNETAKAVSELLRLFVVEARSRASIEVSWSF